MTGSPARVLVVVGEGPSGERLRSLCVPIPGLEVMSAASLGEARHSAAREPPDLILAQDLLPDGTAADLLANGAAIPPLPVVLVSEDLESQAVRRGLEAGAVDCVLPEELSPSGLPRLAARAKGTWEHIAARRRAEAEAGELRGRLDLITGKLGVGFALISPEYRTLWANEETRRLFGDVVGRPCFEAYSRRSEVCPGCGVRAVFEEGAERAAHEQRGYDPASRPLWCEILAAPVRNADGTVAAALKMFVPVTERKRAEEGLRRGLAYERMVAELAAAAVRADAPQRFQDECVRILSETLDVSRIYIFEHRDDTDTMDNTVEWVAPGVTPQRDFLQGIPAASVPWWMDRVRADEVISFDVGEIPGERERELLEAQGICSVLVIPLFVGTRYFGFLGLDECREPRRWLPEDVEVLRTAGRILSVTLERRSAEQALRDSEARYRKLYQEFQAVLDAIPDNLTLQSPDLEILWANRGAAASVERQPEEVIGLRCHDVWHRSRRACDPCPVRQCFETGKPAELCAEDARGRTWELRAVPVGDDTGAVTGVIELGRDITERRRSEAERETLIRELRARNEALHHFTSTVSHDLKGPLTTIRGFAGLIEREVREGRAERAGGYAGHIGAAAERMKLLLDDLLSLCRIGRFAQPPQAVPLGEVAREAAASFAVQSAERAVEVEIDAELPVVQGDPVRLREVFENLLGNALKFLGEQPRPQIRVGWRPEAGGPVFYVRDNGIGIEPADRERVFELFERVHSGSPGTGLGLSIVKRVVEAHGGRVWVESEGSSRGSTFCFTLGGRDRAG
ncbi:MAG: PAS domain-containing protein [Deferrisomatales bacterium]